jgi:two-component sensor histidine kinase
MDRNIIAINRTYADQSRLARTSAAASDVAHRTMKQDAIEKSVQRLDSLAKIHALVMNDSHAMTFQTLAQYRSAIAAAIAQEIRK